VLRLQSDDGMNRLTKACVMELTNTVDVLTCQMRALIITGNHKFFSAGADLHEIVALNGASGLEFSQMGQRLMNSIEFLPVPVYAAISGYCMGGGLDLALACHRRIASPNAIFGHRGAALGLITGWGGTQRLPRLVGQSRALDLVLTGRLIDAQEALRIGLVDRVVPAGQALAAAFEFAAQFATLPPLAVRYAKHAMHVGRDLDLREANGVEIETFTRAFDTDDRVEGLAAFLEKRPAQFRGR